MDLGDWLRRARALAYHYSGLNAVARRRLDGSRGVILTYHRVVPREIAERDAVEEAMFVTPESFRMQLEVLKDRFHVMPLWEMAGRILEGRSLPRGACAISFDDGWRDNFEFAYPALRRAGLCATIFVVTGRMGTPGAFWPDEVRRRMQALDAPGRSRLAASLGAPAERSDPDGVLAHLKGLDEAEREAVLGALPEEGAPPARELMSWEEVGALDPQLIDIESHGVSHAILTGLGDEAAERELRGSLAELRERGLGRHALFAYPSGRFDARVARLVAGTGYRAAFTLIGRTATLAANAMEIPRLGVHDGMGRTRLDFSCKVPGRV